MNEGEFVGATAGPIEFTSCFTSSATVPCSPRRGVTVRITPASRYSTVWLSPAVVVVVVVVVVAAATCPVVWLVTTGTDVDTLMTAFLFSEVMTCGFETMLTLLSLASALSTAMKWSVAHVKAVSPWPKAPSRGAGPLTPAGTDIVPPADAGVGGSPGGRAAGRRNVARRGGWGRGRTRRPGRGRRRRGQARRRGRPGVARAVDGVQRRGEVFRLGILRVVNEDAAPAVDIDVELRDQAPD